MFSNLAEVKRLSCRLASHLLRKHPGMDQREMENILIIGDRNVCGAYVVKKTSAESGIAICNVSDQRYLEHSELYFS